MKLILTLFALFATISASAQTTVPQEVIPQDSIKRKSIKEQLAAPAQRDSLTTINATVTISEHGNAATIVDDNL
jgi:hypothetical protein